jgi:hypothetical protein
MHGAQKFGGNEVGKLQVFVLTLVTGGNYV